MAEITSSDEDLTRAHRAMHYAVDVARTQVSRYVDAVELFGIVGAECPSRRSLQLATLTLDEALEIIEHVTERLTTARDAMAKVLGEMGGSES